MCRKAQGGQLSYTETWSQISGFLGEASQADGERKQANQSGRGGGGSPAVVSARRDAIPQLGEGLGEALDVRRQLHGLRLERAVLQLLPFLWPRAAPAHFPPDAAT